MVGLFAAFFFLKLRMPLRILLEVGELLVLLKLESCESDIAELGICKRMMEVVQYSLSSDVNRWRSKS